MTHLGGGHLVSLLVELLLEFGVLLEFDLVKSLSVYTVDIGLGDECTGINALHDAEYGHRLHLAAYNEEYLHIVLGVPAHAVHDCDARRA